MLDQPSYFHVALLLYWIVQNRIYTLNLHFLYIGLLLQLLSNYFHQELIILQLHQDLRMSCLLSIQQIYFDYNMKHSIQFYSHTHLPMINQNLVFPTLLSNRYQWNYSSAIYNLFHKDNFLQMTSHLMVMQYLSLMEFLQLFELF